ncbi:cytochrome oxidase c assembly-domain-containing protein [Chaetomium strumarium]|uniref:Cytochrome oxidase c assembly-domain-containing protein n=1 Tax=Chaetomium strumarium TaxID=1170767 RepID=A0AAJ0LZ79_9PEZI|nr:cytochrome oxidase c assembly-domain-containing protein [Chaetomium strumarium]
MPISTAPRSVTDATRFTATTPHASSKAAAPTSRFTPPKSGSLPPGAGSGAPPPLETPEQKVARLRAAHQRAKATQVSRFDRLVASSRRLFDSAHRVTVFGLVGFTVIAGLVTAYTAVDMIMYNKKRTAEWIEAQKKIEADSLEAARIAYMTGKATEEQIALVEDYLERERDASRKTSFFSKLPGALEPASSAPASASASGQQQRPQSITETVSWPSNESASEPESQPSQDKENKGGLWAWLTSNLKREEEGDTVMSPQPRLGWESLSEEDDGKGVRDSDLVRAVGAKAQAAFEKEKENQRKGGPLDRVGVADDAKGEAQTEAGAGEQQGKKKGWLW